MMTGDRYGGIVVVAIAVVQWNFCFFPCMLYLFFALVYYLFCCCLRLLHLLSLIILLPWVAMLTNGNFICFMHYNFNILLE